MKKITLGIAALFAAFTMNAQDCCTDAVEVTAGNTYTVDAINGEAATYTCYTNPNTGDPIIAENAEWFVYTTGNENMIVTISSDLETNSGADTRLSIFTGTCDTELTCYAANDDVNYVGENDPANNLTSTTEFFAEAGVTYYIIWDDQWEGTGFDFEVTEELAPESPGVATTPTPADNAVNVEVIETTDSQNNPTTGVEFSWEAPSTGASGYRVYLGNSPDNLNVLGTTQNTQVTITGMEYSTTYYWKIESVNQYEGVSILIPATGSSTWSFTTEGEMSVDDFKNESLTHYVSNGLLNINAEQQLNKVTLYSILGSQVASQEVNNTNATIEISNLQAGVYLAQVQVEGKTKTFKFVKK